MANTSESHTSKRIGPGSITLEALLDSPSLSPLSPLAESLNGACVVSHSELFQNNHALPVCNNVHRMPSLPISSSQTCSQSESTVISDELAARRKSCMREVCMELLTVLRGQDIHGYFLSPKVCTSGIGLLEVEKRVLRSKYTSFKFFQTDVFKSINATPQNCASDPLLYSEGQRLHALASDWFASLAPDLLQFLTSDPSNLAEDSISCADKTSSTGSCLSTVLNDLHAETHLRVLNPDNRGIIGPNEYVRTLGEEVGPLRCGTGLLPHGGYREDRRNKVVPYTYLDYGPYYSFAPRYDSGASHCTPEANQLVLGTSWLPARLAYLTPTPAGSRSLPETTSTEWSDDTAEEEATAADNNTCGDNSVPGTCTADDDDDVAKALSSDLVSAALASGDQALAVSLAVDEIDQMATRRLSLELAELLPGPEVEDDSCVFALCLANAFTKDWLRDMRKLDGKEPVAEVSCDLDSVPAEEERNKEDVSAKATRLKASEANADNVDDDGDQALAATEDEVGLEETAADLRRLQQVQYRRLGQSPGQTTANPGSSLGSAQSSDPGGPHGWPQLQPSREELATAHRLAGGLVQLLARARPRDLVHPYALRRAMGLSPNCAPLEPQE